VAAPGDGLHRFPLMPKPANPVTPFGQSLHDAVETFQSLAPLESEINAAAAAVLDCLESGEAAFLRKWRERGGQRAHRPRSSPAGFPVTAAPTPALLHRRRRAAYRDRERLRVSGHFSRQVRAYGRRGDILIALTTSGKSRNVLSSR